MAIPGTEVRDRLLARAAEFELARDVLLAIVAASADNQEPMDPARAARDAVAIARAFMDEWRRGAG